MKTFLLFLLLVSVASLSFRTEQKEPPLVLEGLCLYGNPVTGQYYGSCLDKSGGYFFDTEESLFLESEQWKNDWERGAILTKKMGLSKD